MPEHQIGEIKYHTFTLFDRYGVNHAMITRHGGVSPKPWASLNLATTVGDEKDRVSENANRVYAAFNINRRNIYDVWQVHGDRVIYTQTPRKSNEPHEKADAIITNQQGLTLLMRFADCVPILLYDPENQVAGIVHAGWKGTSEKIVIKTVETMKAFFGSDPNDLIAGIGPSIAVHHYMVGSDVIQEVRRSLGHKASEYLVSINGSIHFDLWKANRNHMESIGIRQIEVSGICTACNTKDWFSHRGENGKSGRFGVFISV